MARVFVALAETDIHRLYRGEWGRQGMVEISMLRSDLRDALQGVGAGQLSPIVRTPLGFAILKVVQRGTQGASKAASSGGTQATAAIGSVKYTFNVGGLPDAEQALLIFEKPSDWNQDPSKICTSRKQSLAAAKDSMDIFLAPWGREAPGKVYLRWT